jgi:hypothetical protein
MLQIGPANDTNDDNDNNKGASDLHGSAATLHAERVDVLLWLVLWTPQELFPRGLLLPSLRRVMHFAE